jgi:hypothetical protein
VVSAHTASERTVGKEKGRILARAKVDVALSTPREKKQGEREQNAAVLEVVELGGGEDVGAVLGLPLYFAHT